MKNVFLALLVAIATTPIASAVIIESGSFYSHVLKLKNLAFTKNSGLYVEPTSAERFGFYNLAVSLYDHNWGKAETQANALGYDLVQFTNTTTDDVYWGVQEQLVNGEQTKGWGSFFVNANPVTNAIVQVPHPFNDINTHRLGARVFERSEANAFMMAGSHRSANGSQTANPTSLPFSIFQEVHQAWSGGYGNSIAWQLHGFGSSTGSRFPDNTDAVSSDGAGNVTPQLLVLDTILDSIDDRYFGDSYVYNLLDTEDPLNIQVNGQGQNGHNPFWRLRAFNNPQGQFSRQAGLTFVHIEASYHIRGNRTRRDTYFANAVVAAIKQTATEQPGRVQSVSEPSSAMALFFGLGILWLRLKQQRNK